MFLHFRQVIDSRVQTRPLTIQNLWNLVTIDSIKLMNKSRCFHPEAQELAPLLPQTSGPIRPQTFEVVSPGLMLGGAIQ